MGGRGAGKSKISRKFGKLTNRVVLSTDTLVTYEAGGLTVDTIVSRYGWKNFRDREYEVLEKLKAMKNIIIDCGGGILVEAPDSSGPGSTEKYSERKADLLKSFCTVVYIQRDMKWLQSKSGRDSGRPDLIGEYDELLRRRFAWYEKAADRIVEMKDLEADDVAKILAADYP